VASLRSRYGTATPPDPTTSLENASSVTAQP
jgi:hypothetical protein